MNKKISAVLMCMIVLGMGVVMSSTMMSDGSGDLTLPVIDIQTKDAQEVTDKENYVSCKVTISNTEEQYELDEEKAGIRGRGNSTWEHTFGHDLPKKSYKVKFDDPVSLFGKGAATKWTLISSYVDTSYCRNAMAFEMGKNMDLAATPTLDFASVYLNGYYEGMYLVCNQVEAEYGRVPINYDPANEDFGFLLELEFRAAMEGTAGNDYFVLSDGMGYDLKDPEPEKVTHEQLETVHQWMQATYDALEQKDVPAGSKDYSKVTERMDVDSWAKTYIIHELFHVEDVGATSFYMYRDAGSDSKLCSGPIWDFDRAAGNDRNLDAFYPDKLYAVDDNIWYHLLMQYPEFKALVGEYLVKYHDTILQSIETVRSFVFEHYSDFEKDLERWTRIGTIQQDVSLEMASLQSYGAHVDYLIRWLKASQAYMEEVYPAPSA